MIDQVEKRTENQFDVDGRTVKTRAFELKLKIQAIGTLIAAQAEAGQNLNNDVFAGVEYILGDLGEEAKSLTWEAAEGST